MNGHLANELRGAARVLLDTNVFIYYLQQEPRFEPCVAPVFEMIDRGEIQAFTSVITLLEVLVRPIRQGRLDLANQYVAVRADSALEAVTTWRKWVGDDNKAMRSLIMAVSGRLVRKLCVQCKVSISPDPEQLRKMNMDPQKVTQIFQERTEPMLDQKGNPVACEICQELRFKGRMGVFEVIIVDDEVREAAIAGAGSSQLRTIIRKQRIPFLQESALERIQNGETSVKEVQRVFATKPTGGGK